jgi:MoaA/NifB/PqqE/SkfB family radical SAM enzyme
MSGRLADKVLKEISYQTGGYSLPPEFLSLIITLRCNFRCRSCSIWEKDKKNEADEADWKKMLENLSKALRPDTFVEINGGEPLLRKDLVLSLVKDLKKKFRRVALNSNGSLISEDVLSSLAAAGLDLIKISFYSLNEKTHNYLRGEQMAFSQAKKAIEMIVAKGLPLEIGLLITAQNINEAPELISYLRSLPGVSIILQPLDEKVESPEAKLRPESDLIADLWPVKEDVEKFFAWVLSDTRNIKNSPLNIKAIRDYYLRPESTLCYRCFAGQRNLVVYPNGDAALCFKGGVVGNILRQEATEILKNAKEERKKIKKCQKYCRIIGCNFSLGLKEFVREKLFKKD